MTESAKRTGKVVRIAAAVLLVPAFGAGVWVGRSMLPRRPPAEVKRTEPASDPWARIDQRELAACQEKVAARSEGRAAPSAAAAPSGETRQDAPQKVVTVEELEVELTQCKKSEVLVSAEVCAAAARQFRALMSLPQNGRWCGPKSRAADLIEENFERCALFADIAAPGTSDDLTKEESSLLAEAIRIHRTLPEEELLRRLKDFVWTCTETPKSTPEQQAPGPL